MDTVLVIEDSRAMQRTLRRLLESDGLRVEFAGSGEEGLEKFQAAPPAAVVLDLKLPGMPGKELCRALKATAPVPVVVVSANADIEDKVLLLELGADDYVTKPFSPKELLARLRRAMRRGAEVARPAPAAGAAEVLRFGDVSVNFQTLEATRAGRALALTAQEFKLLRFFSRAPRRVFSRAELLNEVWGYENYPTTRTVDNYILRLRQKLEPDPARPRHFLTLHGSGYKFSPAGEDAVAEA